MPTKTAHPIHYRQAGNGFKKVNLEGALRQPQLHRADRRPVAARKRSHPRHALSLLGARRFQVPVQVAAELDRVLGQPLHHAPGDVGLLPAEAVWASGDCCGDKALNSISRGQTSL
jgi:hypothetical protein